MKKRILMPLVHGNEEIETITIFSILSRAGNILHLVKCDDDDDNNIHHNNSLEVTLSRGLRIKTNNTLNNIIKHNMQVNIKHYNLILSYILSNIILSYAKYIKLLFNYVISLIYIYLYTVNMNPHLIIIHPLHIISFNSFFASFILTFLNPSQLQICSAFALLLPSISIINLINSTTSSEQ